jgi:hypothetical protein
MTLPAPPAMPRAMPQSTPHARPPALRRARAGLAAAAAATALALLQAPQPAVATPLDFTLVNVTGGTASRIAVASTAVVGGVPIAAVPQVAPGGINGAGSLSTLWNDTGNGSRLATELTQQGLTFLDTQGALARNASGSLGNALALAPGPAAVGATGPAAYGLRYTQPQSIALPPIDLTPFGLTGTLNLGTLTSLDTKVALRGLQLDVLGSVPLQGAYGGPQSFAAGALQVALAGSADVLLGGTVQQATTADYIAAGIALAALQTTLAQQGATLTVQNNGFIARSYTIGLAQSTALPAGAVPNAAAGTGTIEPAGAQLRLTVPLNFTVAPSTPLDFLFTASYTFDGTLVGEVPFVVVEVPEPGTWALMALGLAVVGCWRARRGGVAWGAAA